jgi:hypothetical protein
MLARELGERVVVVEEAQPPALDAVMRGGRFARLAVPALELRADRCGRSPASACRCTAAGGGASRLRIRFASSTASRRSSGRHRRELFGIELDRRSPSVCRASTSFFRCVLLGRSSCIVGSAVAGPYNSRPFPHRPLPPMPDARFTYSLDTLREMVADVLRLAREQGATEAEADVSEGYGQTVTVRRDEVETIEYNRDKSLGVSVYIGKQRGYASSSDLAPKAIRDTVAARSRSRASPPPTSGGSPTPR